MKYIRSLTILNLLALAIHIILSFATQFKLVNTVDVAQVSNQFPTLFTPAGITFAIWGLIYVALLAMCIYHLVISFIKNENHEANKATDKMGPWFILNNLATAAWLYVWTHQMIGLAEILIVFQLISLIIIHSLLGIQEPEHSLSNKIFTQAPLSIYLGWISIATIANTAVYLSSVGWSRFGFSETAWAMLMIGAAIFITMLMIFFKNNILFAVVVLWALWGIIIKQEELQSFHPSLINAAWIGIAFTGVAILIQAFRMQHHPGEISVMHEFSPEKVR
jgi:hypothetical protein